jgi:hypothetical protein
MDDSPLEGLSSLIQLSGVTVPARARFVGEALVSSTLSSLTLGLSCGLFGAMVSPFGPLLPFLCGAWSGYTLGLIGHWRSSQRLALDYARLYPTLMAHALGSTQRGIVIVPRSVMQASEQVLLIMGQNEVDTSITTTSTTTAITTTSSTNPTPSSSPTLEEWIQQGGVGRLSWSILAAQSCRADVEELERQRRQTLMEQHQEKYYGGTTV